MILWIISFKRYNKWKKRVNRRNSHKNNDNIPQTAVFNCFCHFTSLAIMCVYLCVISFMFVFLMWLITNIWIWKSDNILLMWYSIVIIFSIHLCLVIKTISILVKQYICFNKALNQDSKAKSSYFYFVMLPLFLISIFLVTNLLSNIYM